MNCLGEPMTGLLIGICCVLLAALSVPLAIAAGSMHGHAIRGVGILLVPVAPAAAIVLALVADIGWWLVLVAAVPVLLMVVGLLLKDDETGRNVFSYLPKRRADRR